MVAVVLLSLVAFSLCSCVSPRPTSRFSLDGSSIATTTGRIIAGSISYGAGFYFPTSTDILDISLLKTDGLTGTVSEISHQRIRSIQRFPVQFTIRYDGNDMQDGDTCMVMVSLSTDGKATAQGFSNLYNDSSSPSGFGEVSVTLYGLN